MSVDMLRIKRETFVTSGLLAILLVRFISTAYAGEVSVKASADVRLLKINGCIASAKAVRYGHFLNLRAGRPPNQKKFMPLSLAQATRDLKRATTSPVKRIRKQARSQLGLLNELERSCNQIRAALASPDNPTPSATSSPTAIPESSPTPLIEPSATPTDTPTPIPTATATPPGGVAPMTSASRASCVAPCGIFFDAIKEPIKRTQNLEFVTLGWLSPDAPGGDGKIYWRPDTNVTNRGWLRWQAPGDPSPGTEVEIASGNQFVLPSFSNNANLEIAVYRRYGQETSNIQYGAVSIGDLRTSVSFENSTGIGMVYLTVQGNQRYLSWQSPGEQAGTPVLVTANRGTYVLSSATPAKRLTVVIRDLPGFLANNNSNLSERINIWELPQATFESVRVFEPSIVQPRGIFSQPAILGARVTRVSSDVQIGSGTLTYDAPTHSVSWQAPGDSRGEGQPVTAAGEIALASGNGASKLFIQADPAKLPPSNLSSEIKIINGGLFASWNSFHYEWDFGDPAAGSWTHGAVKSDGTAFSKNKDFGWNAGHVYEHAGVFHVGLTVIDDLNREHHYSQDITVQAEPQGGWSTYYFSSSGSDSNGDGSIAKPYKSFAKAMNLAGANARLLFKRGDEFPVPSGAELTGKGPLLISAYGEPSLPRPKFLASDGFINAQNFSDLRFTDLTIKGPWPEVQKYTTGIGGLGPDGLALRNQLGGFFDAFFLSGSSQAIVQDNVLVNQRSYNIWTNDNPRIAALGNLMFSMGQAPRSTGDNLMRAYTNKFVLSHNTFDRVLGGYNAVRIQGSGEFIEGSQGKWIIGGFNHFNEGAKLGGGAFDHYSNLQTLNMQHLAYFGNSFISTLEYAESIGINGGDDVVVYSNRAYATDQGAWFINGGTQYNPYGIPDVDAFARMRFFNNTFYASGTSGNRFLVTDTLFGKGNTELSAWDFRNNVFSIPQSTDTCCSHMYQSKQAPLAGSPLISDFNLMDVPARSLPQLVSDSTTNYDFAAWQQAGHDENGLLATPALKDADLFDFRLSPESYAVGSGQDVAPFARIDGDGNRWGPDRDMGSFKYDQTECRSGEQRLCGLQLGVCTGAKETCTAGAWPGCKTETYANYSIKYQPHESTCDDGFDNDCNGVADDQEPRCVAANSPPTNLRALSVTRTTVTLAWSDTSFNSNNFVIERKSDAPNSSFEAIQTLGPSLTQFVDTAVATGTHYVYRVRESNYYGTSDPSNEVSVTTPQ